VVHVSARTTALVHASGGFQERNPLLDGSGLGLDVLQIGFTGLSLGPEFAEIGLQFSNALRPADEPPLEAPRMFLMVTVVFVAPMMTFMPTLAAATALDLAASTMAAACLLFAPAATATGARCLLVVATVAMTALLLASAATFVPAMTSVLSAHRLHSPVSIWNCCLYSVRNRSNCTRVSPMLAAPACRNSTL
jgi:hypothetical protein